MRSLSTSAALLVVLSLPPALAFAQAGEETAAEDTAAARSLFREGLALTDAENWQEAADRFRRSLALRPSPVVAYNLASALARLGRVVEASELLRGIARNDDADIGAREASEALLATVLPRIGRLTLTVEGELDAVELQLDERPFRHEAVGVEVPVDPGAHRIVALRDSEVIAETSFEVAEGAAATASLELPAVPVVESPDVAPDIPADSGAEYEPSWGPLPEAQVRQAGTQTQTPPAREAPRLVTPPEEMSWWESPLFWTGVGVGAAAIAAAIIVIAVVTGGGEATPIQGSLDPGIVELGR